MYLKLSCASFSSVTFAVMVLTELGTPALPLATKSRATVQAYSPALTKWIVPP